MKEWREVFGTEAEQPEEFDTTASPTTVYQRRNIKKATKEDADGKKSTRMAARGGVKCHGRNMTD